MTGLVAALTFAGAQEVIMLPLPTKGTNAPWWTNWASTNIVVGWQAWQAMNTNLMRLTNAIAVLRTNAVTTNTPPANTNASIWLIFTNVADGTSWAVPAAPWP